MPGPQKTKGALRNTRFKSKMKRNNTTQKRKQAFYIEDLDIKRREGYLTMLAGFALGLSRKMEEQGKIKPVGSCDGSFMTYYNTTDSFKLIEELSKLTSRSSEVQRVAKREFRQAGKTKNKLFSLKVLLFLFTLSFTRQAEAKWYEISSPPGELSALDVSSAAALAGGMALMAGGALTGNPAAFLLGTQVASCGHGLAVGASGVRLYNSATGKYPLSAVNEAAEVASAFAPGSGQVARLMYAGLEGERTARFNPQLGTETLAPETEQGLSFLIDTAIPAAYTGSQFVSSGGPLGNPENMRSMAKSAINYLEPRLPASVTGAVPY